MMIIDGHAHALGEFGDVQKIEEIMTKLNVDKIVLCPTGGDPTKEPKRPKPRKNALYFNPRAHFLSNKFMRLLWRNTSDRDFGNEYVYNMTQQLPEKIIQFFWVNFNDPQYFEKLMDCYHKWRFQGIKLHQPIVKFRNDSEEMKRIARFAGVHLMPVFIHVYSAKEARRLVKLAREHPATNFIIAHLMGLEQIIKKGKDLTNIYFDISTYYIISQKRILKAMKHFGADHVLLGSDSPLGYDNLKNNIEKIKSMEISEEEKALILGENIARLLEL